MIKIVHLFLLFFISYSSWASDKLTKYNQCFYEILLSFNTQLNEAHKTKLLKIIDNLNDNAKNKIGSIMAIGKARGFDKSELVVQISRDIENISNISVTNPIAVTGYTKVNNDLLTVGIKTIGIDEKFMFTTFVGIGQEFVGSLYRALELPTIPQNVSNLVNQISRSVPKVPRSITDKLPETIQTWFFPKGEGFHMAQIVYGTFKGITKVIASNPEIKIVKINADLVMNKNLKKMFTEFGFVNAETKLPLTLEEIEGRGKNLELLLELN